MTKIPPRKKTKMKNNRNNQKILHLSQALKKKILQKLEKEERLEKFRKQEIGNKIKVEK